MCCMWLCLAIHAPKWVLLLAAQYQPGLYLVLEMDHVGKGIGGKAPISSCQE